MLSEHRSTSRPLAYFHPHLRDTALETKQERKHLSFIAEKKKELKREDISYWYNYEYLGHLAIRVDVDNVVDLFVAVEALEHRVRLLFTRHREHHDLEVLLDLGQKLLEVRPHLDIELDEFILESL